MVPTPSTAGSGYEPREADIHLQGELELKRGIEYADIQRPPKKLRTEIPVGIP